MTFLQGRKVLNSPRFANWNKEDLGLPYSKRLTFKKDLEKPSRDESFKQKSKYLFLLNKFHRKIIAVQSLFEPLQIFRNPPPPSPKRWNPTTPLLHSHTIPTLCIYLGHNEAVMPLPQLFLLLLRGHHTISYRQTLRQSVRQPRVMFNPPSQSIHMHDLWLSPVLRVR